MDMVSRTCRSLLYLGLLKRSKMVLLGTVFLLSVFFLVQVDGDTMICRGLSDDIFSDGGVSEIQEKVRGLEEQVRQLRKLVEKKTDIYVPTTIDGLPRDCSELYDSGFTTDGVYTISPDGRCPFSVYCDMTRGGWTLIQRRMDGSVNFYRPWDEYVRGFGDVEGEHWLGLEKIHRLTRDGSQIFFHLEDYNGSNDTAHYKSFIVHDVTSAYRMNVDKFGYEGTLSELFSFHDGMKFSTYDRDNDAHSSYHCCEKYGGGGGWWYNNCYHLGHVNGIYEKREIGGIGIWKTGNIPYHNINISIKPREGMC